MLWKDEDVTAVRPTQADRKRRLGVTSIGIFSTDTQFAQEPAFSNAGIQVASRDCEGKISIEHPILNRLAEIRVTIVISSLPVFIHADDFINIQIIVFDQACGDTKRMGRNCR